jgi:hypothetical protein
LDTQNFPKFTAPEFSYFLLLGIWTRNALFSLKTPTKMLDFGLTKLTFLEVSQKAFQIGNEILKLLLHIVSTF